MDLPAMSEQLADQAGCSVEQVNMVAGWVAIAAIYVGLLLLGRGARYTAVRTGRGLHRVYAWAFLPPPPPPPAPPEPPRPPYQPTYTVLGKAIRTVLEATDAEMLNRWSIKPTKKDCKGQFVAEIPSANGRCATWTLRLETQRYDRPLVGGDVSWEIDNFNGTTLSSDDREAIGMAAAAAYTRISQHLDAKLIPTPRTESKPASARTSRGARLQIETDGCDISGDEQPQTVRTDVALDTTEDSVFTPVTEADRTAIRFHFLSGSAHKDDAVNGMDRLSDVELAFLRALIRSGQISRYPTLAERLTRPGTLLWSKLCERSHLVTQHDVWLFDTVFNQALCMATTLAGERVNVIVPLRSPPAGSVFAPWTRGYFTLDTLGAYVPVSTPKRPEQRP